MIVNDEWTKLTPHQLQNIENELKRSRQSSTISTVKTKSPVPSEFKQTSSERTESIENLISRVNSDKPQDSLQVAHLDFDNMNKFNRSY